MENGWSEKGGLLLVLARSWITWVLGGVNLRCESVLLRTEIVAKACQLQVKSENTETAFLIRASLPLCSLCRVSSADSLLADSHLHPCPLLMGLRPEFLIISIYQNVPVMCPHIALALTPSGTLIPWFNLKKVKAFYSVCLLSSAMFTYGCFRLPPQTRGLLCVSWRTTELSANTQKSFWSPVLPSPPLTPAGYTLWGQGARSCPCKLPPSDDGGKVWKENFKTQLKIESTLKHFS